jgi:hypothetical protein
MRKAHKQMAWIGALPGLPGSFFLRQAFFSAKERGDLSWFNG